jgi:hypothetical protein
MEDFFPTSTASGGERVHPLPPGERLTRTRVGGRAFDLFTFMAREKTTGILELQDGVARLWAYDQVSVRQLLTMTSGVRWNEVYTDAKSDVVLLFSPQRRRPKMATSSPSVRRERLTGGVIGVSRSVCRSASPTLAADPVKSSSPA